MYWIIGAIVVFLAYYFLIHRAPMRRAIGFTMASQRALKRRDFAGAVDFCRLSHEAAGKLREPARSQVQSKIEIQWGTLLYRQGKMREAEEKLRSGFAHTRGAGCHADMRPAYLVWGDLCMDEERYPEAEQHYNVAIEGEEQIGNLAGMIFALQRLGDCLIRQGRRTDAEEAINRASALEIRVVHEQMEKEGKDPAQHRVISWSMPDLHFCREQYEEARQLYREKVTFWQKSVTRPDNIDLGHLQTRLAYSELRTGHVLDAYEMYSRAEATYVREWGEDHPKVLAARKAKAAVEPEALKIRDRKLALIDAHLVAYRRGDYQAQLEIAQGFRADGWDEPSYLFYHGSACFELGRLDEAEQALRRSIAAEKNNMLLTIARDELGRILMAAERWDEAEACFREGVAKDPERGGSHRAIAELLLRRGGSKDDALRAAKTAVERERATPVEKLCKEAVELNTSEALAVYAWALAANHGDVSAIEGALQEAFQLCPESTVPIRAEIHYFAGQAYAALGNSEQSNHQLRRASEIDPIGNYGRLAQAAPQPA